MVFDFKNIIGTENSKEENFSQLSNNLIIKMFPNAKPVEGKGGDEGIDTFIGEFDGVIKVFQHKYFIEKVGVTQRKQIIKSLVTVLKKHQVSEWILMLPIDLNPNEIRWFNEAIIAKFSHVKFDWWGKSKIQSLLVDFPNLAIEFQPKPQIVNNVFINQENKKVNKDVIESYYNLLKTTKTIEELKGLIKTSIDSFKNKTILNVLIWGPSIKSTSIYNKKIQLKNFIIELGHVAHLSEEIWDKELLALAGLNISFAEFIQVQTYDYIICLMESPGTIAEVHDFAKSKRIATKMLLCVDEKHKNSYISQGIFRIFEGLNGRLHYFKNPDDINQCHLLNKVVDQIVKVAEAKQWEIATGGLY